MVRAIAISESHERKGQDQEQGNPAVFPRKKDLHARHG
jgi:hypothetical protein